MTGPLPDAEVAVIRRLRDRPAVIAMLGQAGHIGRRLSGERPALVITRSGGGPIRDRVADRPRVDIDAWAADADTASLLIRVALAELATPPRWQTDDAVVSNAATVSGPVPLPDPVSTDARYTATVALTVAPRRTP